MTIRLIGFVLIIAVKFGFSACRTEDPDEIWENDRNKILAYISTNQLNAIEHFSGIFYVVNVEGTGPRPTINSVVNVKYTGRLLDGTVFDASPGAAFNLANTIRGWQIGIPLFRVGGKGLLMIPSALGYGPFPPFGSGIPRNAPLVFEIEIIDMAN